MAHLSVFTSQKAGSGGGRGGGGATAVVGRQFCGLGRLMRKLRTRSRKYLCMAPAIGGAGASSFGCQYDPSSYARNFDGLGDDDDSTHFFHTFSARFVNSTRAAAAASSPSKSRNSAAPASAASSPSRSRNSAAPVAAASSYS